MKVEIYNSCKNNSWNNFKREREDEECINRYKIQKKFLEENDLSEVNEDTLVSCFKELVSVKEEVESEEEIFESEEELFDEFKLCETFEHQDYGFEIESENSMDEDEENEEENEEEKEEENQESEKEITSSLSSYYVYD